MNEPDESILLHFPTMAGYLTSGYALPLSLCVLLLGTAPAAHAQRLSDLPSDTRFHVQAEKERGRDTTSGGGRSDSLVVQDAAPSLVALRNRIQPLEWRERNESRWPHALFGGLYG